MKEFKSEKIQKHRELANKIKENLESTDSVIKEKASHEAYFDNLPEGLDKKTVQQVQGYNDNFVAAAHLALGDISADILTKNKEIDRVVGKVGFFGPKDSIETVVDRTKSYQNAFAKDGEDKEITKHFVMNSTVTASGYGIKAIKKAMSEEFRDKLNK